MFIFVMIQVHQEFISEKVAGGLKHYRAVSQLSTFAGHAPVRVQATMVTSFQKHCKLQSLKHSFLPPIIRERILEILNTNPA
jgi:hypothetical protein